MHNLNKFYINAFLYESITAVAQRSEIHETSYSINAPHLTRLKLEVQFPIC